MGALEQNGKTYIVALLACGWPNNRTYKWSDTRKLMEYGLAAYERCDLDDIALDGSRFAPVPVEHAQGGRIGEQVYMKLHAVLKKDLSHVLLREGEQVTVEYRIAQKLSAPESSIINWAAWYCGNIRWRPQKIWRNWILSGA